MSIWNFLKEMDQLQSQLGELARLNSVGGWPRMSFLPGASSRHYPMMNVSADWLPVLTVRALRSLRFATNSPSVARRLP